MLQPAQELEHLAKPARFDRVALAAEVGTTLAVGAELIRLEVEGDGNLGQQSIS